MSEEITFEFGQLPISESPDRGQNIPILKLSLNNEANSGISDLYNDDYFLFRLASRNSGKPYLETKGYYALKLNRKNYNAYKKKNSKRKNTYKSWVEKELKECMFSSEGFNIKQHTDLLEKLVFVKAASLSPTLRDKENIKIRNNIRDKFDKLYLIKRLFKNLPAKTVPLIEGMTSFEYNIARDEITSNNTLANQDNQSIPAMFFSVVGDIDLPTLVDGIKKMIHSSRCKPFEESQFLHPKLAQYYTTQIENNLSKFKHIFKPTGNDVFDGLKSSAWIEFVEGIIRTVKRVHNQNIIHGSLRQENVRITIDFKNLKEVKLPTDKDDADESIFISSFFKCINISIVDFDDEVENDSTDFEGKSSHVFDEAKDIFGLGKILYYLACGRTYDFPPDGEKRQVSKSEIQKYIESRIPSYGNDPETNQFSGIAKIIDKCFRYESHERYSCCESLLETLNIFRLNLPFAFEPKTVSSLTVTGNEDKPENEKPFNSAVKRINSIFSILYKKVPKYVETIRSYNFFNKSVKKETVEDNPDDLNKKDDDNEFDTTTFMKLSQFMCNQYIENTLNLAKGHLEVYGNRETIINFLTKYLSSLMSGNNSETEYLYVTFTRPEFWSDENLGCSGRFIALNKIIALNNKVKTVRIFLTTKGQKKPENYPELQAQKELCLRLLETDSEHYEGTKKKSTILEIPKISEVKSHDEICQKICENSAGANLFYTGYVEVDKSEIDKLYNGHKYVALIYNKNRERYSALSFYSHLENGNPVIHKVRLSTLRRGEHSEFIKEFAGYLNKDVSGLESILNLPKRNYYNDNSVC